MRGASVLSRGITLATGLVVDDPVDWMGVGAVRLESIR
jgi:hypothetical protein